MDFSSAARELYGVPPGEFTGTRKRLVQEAKADGDAALAKRIGALRRPTLPAWAVNLLSRSAADDLGELLDVGTRLREAWSSGGGIGGLEQRRGELVALLVRRARELAADSGQPLRDLAVREVEDTLQAATVDADIAEEVRQGHLTQPRSHTGFVPAGFPVSLDRPEAPPRKKPPRRKEAAPRERPREEAREEAPPRAAEDARRSRTQEKARQAAVRRVQKADRELAERESEHAEAREDLRTAEAEVGRLRRALDKVRRDLDRAVTTQETAARRLERTGHRRDKAAQAAREAHREADEAAGDAAGAI